MQAAYVCLADPHAGPVPVATILRIAGVSSRAFYRHFMSKDDLFLALLEQEGQTVIGGVDRVAAEAAGSPVDQLEAWIAALFDLMVDPGQRMKLTVIDSEEVRAAKGYREIRERLHAARERGLSEILRRGLDDGSFPLAEPDTDAVAINAIVSRVLGGQTTADPEVWKKAHVAVVSFALRAVGATSRR